MSKFEKLQTRVIHEVMTEVGFFALYDCIDPDGELSFTVSVAPGQIAFCDWKHPSLSHVFMDSAGRYLQLDFASIFHDKDSIVRISGGEFEHQKEAVLWCIKQVQDLSGLADAVCRTVVTTRVMTEEQAGNHLNQLMKMPVERNSPGGDVVYRLLKDKLGEASPLEVAIATEAWMRKSIHLVDFMSLEEAEEIDKKLLAYSTKEVSGDNACIDCGRSDPHTRNPSRGGKCFLCYARQIEDNCKRSF